MRERSVVVSARLLAVAVPFLLASCSSSIFEPARRLGPPSLVVHQDEPRLWLMTKQEEQFTRTLGRLGRHSSRTYVRETQHHIELQCHDSHTTDRLWKRRLLTLKQNEGGNSSEARILGQDGAVVWLFVHNQPVAVSAADGSPLAEREQIEERNTSLQGVMPKELKFYAFDDGLIITAADSRRYKVRAPDFAAEPYKPVSEESFSRIQSMSSTWNGSYHTADFITRSTTLAGRWIGLFTEREAQDAGNDSFGDRFKDSATVLNEGARARRTFWTARIGKTKEFTEGSHDRLFDVAQIPGAPDYLAAGFLIRAGTKQPLMLQEPEGLLLLHRTRVDADGRLALTRLDAGLQPQWTAPLPMNDLGNRNELPDRLLMYGSVQLTANGITQWQEFIVSTALRNGRTNAWNVTLESSVPSAELERADRE
jgi:hypothetical protein